MTVTLTSAGGTTIQVPAASVLLQGTQTSASAVVTIAIPAGTYSVVADYPMQVTINSVNFFIPGGNVATSITTAAVATSCTITNLSMGLQQSLKSLPSFSANIVYGAGLFVALPSTSSNLAYTSPDGITWTARTLPATIIWNCIATNGTNLFVALGGTTTQAATSTDGITWTTQTCISGTWNAVSWNGTVFCAVSSVSGTAAQTSPTGVTWTLRTLPSTGGWTGILWNGTQYLAWVQGAASAGTSPDGITWTARTLGNVAGNKNAIAWGNGIYIGYTNGIYTSPDGITWTVRTPLLYPNPANPFNDTVITLTSGPLFVNGQFIFSGYINAHNATIGNQYFTVNTPDGITWSSKLNSIGPNDPAAGASNATTTVSVNSTTNLYSTLLPNPFAIYAPPGTIY